MIEAAVRWTSALCTLAILVTLGGCASNDEGQEAEFTVWLSADYPSYDADSLVAESTLIVEGRVIETSPSVLTAHYEGDTPEENPLLGLSEAEKSQAIEGSEVIPATDVSIAVTNVYTGDVEIGETIVVVQTGGESDGTTYAIEGQVPLTASKEYLLFLTDSYDGKFAVLGGSAGTYRGTKNGEFEPVDAANAPFDELDQATVKSLVIESEE